MSQGDRITTLELRQRTANNVISNGDYKTTLQTPITIEEGDQIQVVNSFLDTTVQTNASVNLESDVDLEFEFLPWVNNLYTDGKLDNEGAPIKIDGMKHIPCTEEVHPNGKPGYEFFQFMCVTRYDDSSNYYGAYTIIYNYLDYNDQPQKVSVYCPTSDIRDLDPQVNVVGVIVKSGSVTLDPTMNLLVINSEPYNMKVSAIPIPENPGQGAFGIILTPVTQNSSFTPITFKKTIRIPQGIYTPDAFADNITKLMTKNNQTSINEVSPTGVQNGLLMSSVDFPPETYTFVNAESSFVTGIQQPGPGFQYIGDIDSAVWVGTSQFALEYDSTSSRYVLVDIHTPIYVGGNKTVVTFRADDGSVFPATAYSGICIRNITATNVESGLVIPQFAYNVLGFETGKLSPNIKYVTGTVLTTVGTAIPNIQFIAGQHYTSAFNGIDAAINKDIGSSQAQAESTYTKVNTSPAVVSIVGDSSESIFGDNIFSTGTYTFGYYKIEINSVFKNLMVGEENIQRNIMAIVSKYYESESYTDGDVGIPYIHKGLPVQLSEIGVRVLNSDNIVPNILGDDNTIFLRITKAEQQPVIQPVQPTKK